MDTFQAIFKQIDKDDDMTVEDVALYDGTPEQAKKNIERIKAEPSMIEQTIFERIQAWGDVRPSSTAVTTTEITLSYAGMLRSAEKIAHKLLELGATRESVVPILSTKQVWVLSAMLGVLKAGAAFMLVDPSQTQESTLSLIAKVHAKVMIRSPDVQDLYIGVAELVLSEQAIASLTIMPSYLPTVDPHSLACVMYTSGSTGEPKAVQITHTAIVTGAVHHGITLNMNESTRVLQYASFSSSACLLDTLTILIHGGCVCMPSEEERLVSLEEAVRAMRCNYLHFTPTVVSMLRPEDFPSVEYLAVGGEAPNASILERWSDKVQVFQVWGAAETSFVATARRYTKGDNPRFLGKFVGCTGVVVNAEDHKHLVPDGTVGEIVLKGPIVAKGYRANLRETRHSFISHQAWCKMVDQRQVRNASAQRTYLTGDLGYFDAQGELMLVGRKDRQIEVGGMRFEMGEIEAAVQGALPLAERLVVDFVRLDGNDQTAAFLVARLDDNTPMDQQAWMEYVASRRANLDSKLIRSLQPRLYLPLGFIPSDTSGKADRKALRALLEGEDALEPARMFQPVPNP